MNERNMVKFRLDPDNVQGLTEEQQERLERLAAMPDAEIDYRDIPRQAGPVEWTRPGALVPEGNKQQITLRLDADVLHFFKGTGKRYQSRINAALREYVRAHTPPA